MRWEDRVYGAVAIDDPALLDLIACPTFQRLKGIRQAGPSALSFPFKTVTRFEHSLGVHVLLRQLGAPFREQVAGLLHDLSHTAFSHAVDFLFTSEEQDHHEQLKPDFLGRPDIVRSLGAMALRPEQFYDDSIYPLLERPIPWLCADRLDYFFRDSLACDVSTLADIELFLAHLGVVEQTIAFTEVAVARRAVELFRTMNRDWWASATESYIYNEFADALREAMRTGALTEADLMADDEHVLNLFEATGSKLIAEKLEHVRHFQPALLAGFAPRIVPKTRWLDPPVIVGGQLRKLSECG